MRTLVERLRRRLPGAPPESDAGLFQTLEVQHRLSRLAREINTIDAAPAHDFALGHHARAARLAYEQTLDEACVLIGAPVEDAGPMHRLMAESRLMHAGWRW